MESGGSRKENSYIGFQENHTLGTLIFSRDCLKGFIPVDTKVLSPNGSLLWIFFFTRDIVNCGCKVMDAPPWLKNAHSYWKMEIYSYYFYLHRGCEVMDVSLDWNCTLVLEDGDLLMLLLSSSWMQSNGCLPWLKLHTCFGRWKFTHTMFFSPNVGNWYCSCRGYY